MSLIKQSTVDSTLDITSYDTYDKHEGKVKDQSRIQESIDDEVLLINYRIKNTHKVNCFKDLDTIHRAEAIMRCRTHHPNCGNVHCSSFHDKKLVQCLPDCFISERVNKQLWEIPEDPHIVTNYSIKNFIK